MALTLDKANTIIAAGFAKGAELGLKPLSICVLDAGGHPIAFSRQDGASNLRFKVAQAKAYGAVSLGMGCRAIFERAQQQPFFIGSLNNLTDGGIVPVPGGALVLDAEGGILGAVGITGDTSDNDEIACVAGVEAAGFKAQP